MGFSISARQSETNGTLFICIPLEMQEQWIFECRIFMVSDLFITHLDNTMQQSGPSSEARAKTYPVN